MNHAKALRILRAAKGISQQDLAKSAKLSKSLISKIEAGDRKISDINRKKISKAIKVPIELIEILAMEPNNNFSKNELEQIGKSLLQINEESIQ